MIPTNLSYRIYHPCSLIWSSPLQSMLLISKYFAVEEFSPSIFHYNFSLIFCSINIATTSSFYSIGNWEFRNQNSTWDNNFSPKKYLFHKKPCFYTFFRNLNVFSIISSTINAYAMHLFPLHVCGDWVFSFKWNSILDFSSHVYLCHNSHIPLWRWWSDLKEIMSLICTWVMYSWCCTRMVKCAFDLH